MCITCCLVFVKPALIRVITGAMVAQVLGNSYMLDTDVHSKVWRPIKQNMVYTWLSDVQV